MTRVARGSRAIWRDICLENREYLLQALDRFSDRLRALRERIAEGEGKALLDHFQHRKQAKDELWMP